MKKTGLVLCDNFWPNYVRCKRWISLEACKQHARAPNKWRSFGGKRSFDQVKDQSRGLNYRNGGYIAPRFMRDDQRQTVGHCDTASVMSHRHISDTTQ
ncbi:hypothetical protein ACF0H5_019350 [Mactra antiquata]